MHQAVQDLVQNRDLGSSALLEKFIQLLKDQEATEVLNDLEALQNTFPLMAVWYFAEKFFQKFGVHHESIIQFSEKVQSEREAVLEKAASALHPFQRFLTLSRSSLVEEAFIRLGQQKSIEVVCSPSFPGNEGLGLQRNLERAHIKVFGVNDWELVDRLPKVDAVVLGADLITDEHIVNKWGIHEVVRHAQVKKKKVFILAEKFKRFPHMEISLPASIQDWSEGNTTRMIQVFEKVPRTPGVIILPN